MSQPIKSIVNITKPGERVGHGDVVRTTLENDTTSDLIYSLTTIPQGYGPIREIRKDAFFRRFTKAERVAFRASVIDEVVDLREYVRGGQTIIMDDYLEQLMIDSTVITQVRIDELLVDGTAEEV